MSVRARFNNADGRTDLIPIGTRVLVSPGDTASWEEVTQSFYGTVQDHWEPGDGFPLWVEPEQSDLFGDDDGIWTRNELDIVPKEDTVPRKFQPGDRVRLSTQAEGRRRAAIGSMHGTVVHYNYANKPVVTWDTDTPAYNAPPEVEIELVPEDAPVPPSPETQALRERLIHGIMENSDKNIPYPDVLGIAKAFESYITGDTK